jgi:hypothetical protein
MIPAVIGAVSSISTSASPRVFGILYANPSVTYYGVLFYANDSSYTSWSTKVLTATNTNAVFANSGAGPLSIAANNNYAYALDYTETSVAAISGSYPPSALWSDVASPNYQNLASQAQERMVTASDYPGINIAYLGYNFTTANTRYVNNNWVYVNPIGTQNVGSSSVNGGTFTNGPILTTLISSINKSGTTITVNTASPHGLLNGEWIYIQGSSSGVNNISHQVSTVNSATSYNVSYTVSSSVMISQGSSGSAIPFRRWWDIAYGVGSTAGGVGRYVIVGEHGYQSDTIPAFKSIYSSSLTAGTWSIGANTSGPTTTGAKSVTFGNGTFVAVGGNPKTTYNQSQTVSGPMIYTSTDGISWAQQTISTGITQPLLSVAYGAGKFVAVGFGGKIVYAADNAVNTWTNATSPTTAIINKIIFSVSKFFATSTDGKVLVSSDGVSWTAYTLPTITGYDGTFISSMDIASF